MAGEATITGKLLSILGADVAEPGSVVFALCGYGSQVPRVMSTGIVARLTTLEVEADANGDIEAELWGNDSINPPGTYYTATVKDSNGDVMQCNAYVFLGGANYDLAGAQPFDPNQPPPALPPLITNLLILIAFSPTPVFPGDTFTAWGITLTGDVTSSSTSNTVAGNLYTFIISQDSTGGHQFVWPTNVFNATPVSPTPSAITVQTFVALANNGPMLPIGPATYCYQ